MKTIGTRNFRFRSKDVPLVSPHGPRGPDTRHNCCFLSRSPPRCFLYLRGWGWVFAVSLGGLWSPPSPRAQTLLMSSNIRPLQNIWQQGKVHGVWKESKFLVIFWLCLWTQIVILFWLTCTFWSPVPLFSTKYKISLDLLHITLLLSSLSLPLRAEILLFMENLFE